MKRVLAFIMCLFMVFTTTSCNLELPESVSRFVNNLFGKDDKEENKKETTNTDDTTDNKEENNGSIKEEEKPSFEQNFEIPNKEYNPGPFTVSLKNSSYADYIIGEGTYNGGDNVKIELVNHESITNDVFKVYEEDMVVGVLSGNNTLEFKIDANYRIEVFPAFEFEIEITNTVGGSYKFYDCNLSKSLATKSGDTDIYKISSNSILEFGLIPIPNPGYAFKHWKVYSSARQNTSYSTIPLLTFNAVEELTTKSHKYLIEPVFTNNQAEIYPAPVISTHGSAKDLINIYHPDYYLKESFWFAVDKTEHVITKYTEVFDSHGVQWYTEPGEEHGGVYYGHSISFEKDFGPTTAVTIFVDTTEVYVPINLYTIRPNASNVENILRQSVHLKFCEYNKECIIQYNTFEKTSQYAIPDKTYISQWTDNQGNILSTQVGFSAKFVKEIDLYAYYTYADYYNESVPNLLFIENDDGNYDVMYKLSDFRNDVGENIIIPSKVNGKNVTRIKDFGFSYLNTDKNHYILTIPSSIKEVGEYAFYHSDLGYTFLGDTFDKFALNAFYTDYYSSAFDAPLKINESMLNTILTTLYSTYIGEYANNLKIQLVDSFEVSGTNGSYSNNVIKLLNSKKVSMLSTLYHEFRHHYQEICMSNPNSVLIPSSSQEIESWKEPYVDPTVDYAEYYKHPREVDSREFSILYFGY